MSDRAGRHPSRGGEPERDVVEMDVGDRDDMVLERPVQVQEDQDDDNRDENDPESRPAALFNSSCGWGITWNI